MTAVFGPTFIDIIEQPHKGVVGADEVGDKPDHAEQQQDSNRNHAVHLGLLLTRQLLPLNAERLTVCSFRCLYVRTAIQMTCERHPSDLIGGR